MQSRKGSLHLFKDAPGSLPKRRGTIQFLADTDKVNIVKDRATYRADRELNLAHFKELMRIFNSSRRDAGGSMSFAEFKEAFSEVLGEGLTEEQMSLMFMKIDANRDNYIDWNDFSTYMLLRAEGQKAMKEEAETELFETTEKVRPILTSHKEPIVKVMCFDQGKRYASCGRDGTFCIWNDKMKIQKTFKNAGRWCAPPLTDTRNVPLQQKLASHGSAHRWIADCVMMGNVHKVAMASDDHQITLYDSNSLEACLCLDLQQTNASSLDYYSDSKSDSVESMLLYGTHGGHVCVLTLNNDKLMQLGGHRQEKVEYIALEKEGPNKQLKSFGSLWKRQAHGDWVTKVAYIPELKAIASCSPDPKHSFVVAALDLNRKWQLHNISVCKGVQAFTFCKFPVALVTGGTDRQLRIWNPHRLARPIAALKGHNSPIVELATDNVHGRIISFSMDRIIKIWDIRKHHCLQSITDMNIHKPDDTSTTLFFDPMDDGRIVTGSCSISVYKIKQKGMYGITKSHDNPIRSVLFNNVFKQIVSGCDGGVVSIWDPYTGQKTFRFSEAHGDSEITAMTFDGQSRRLITGARDGGIRVWNFNNGQLLQELVKEDTTEVTGLSYIDMKDTKYIVATGWNRKISLFPDIPNALIVHPTFTWPDTKDDQMGWHDDDILTMDFSPPHMLATASYDGEIVICNMRSGHVIHRLRPVFNDWTKCSIDKILFLQERSKNRAASSLVSTGADGVVRFWNIHIGTCTFESSATKKAGAGIFSMTCNTKNTVLFVGDSDGWISLFDIEHVSTNIDEEANIMRAILRFKAQDSCISCLDISETTEMIFCAAEEIIRCFTMKGELVGTLGKTTPWDLLDPATYESQSDRLSSPDDDQEDENELPFEEKEVKVVSSKSGIQTSMASRNLSRSFLHLATTDRSRPRSVKTADVTSRQYNSWFSNSLYARENLFSSKKFDKNRLQPIELGDIPKYGHVRSKSPTNGIAVLPKISSKQE